MSSANIMIGSIFTGTMAAGLASLFWGSSKPADPVSSLPSPPRSPSPSGAIAPSPVGKGTVPSSSPLVDPQGFFKYGFPGPIHDVEYREEFVSVYDRRMRNPAWVVEQLTPASLNVSDGDRGNSIFREDTTIPATFRARLADYFRSGYDRGHQAPAADAKFSQLAMNQTFYLTNMCPQVGEGFNRDYWSHFEYFVRNLTKSYNSVRVVTGPLYLPKQDADGKWRVSYEVIGNPPNVAVPTHFFKVIVGEDPISSSSDKLAVGAFVLPNEKINNTTPLRSFQVPVDAVERSAGIQLLQNVTDDKKLDLCQQVKCEITVREFAQRALPAPKPMLSLPPPRK